MVGDKLIASHQFECRGVEAGESAGGLKMILEALKERERSAQPIVNIYESGKSRVLCKYFSNGECIAGEFSNTGYGSCPYFSEK